MKRIVAFSENRFDQWRLSQVGGKITFKKGRPVFQFDTSEQYQRYLALNELRYRK